METEKYKFRIYYEDTDAGGIVYHARYLMFAERSRGETLRMAGFPPKELAEKRNLGFVVRQLEIRYYDPMELDDEGEVRNRMIEEKAMRVIVEQEIFNLTKNKVAARLKVELVLIDCKTLRLCTKPPEDLRLALRHVWNGEYPPEALRQRIKEANQAIG
ncbi:YbgC/FadM family acyl-CoA thioesterase [Acetobacteraceae bacterium]|nr:YbgC/FadM family acyl-CoA thioesterase [Acetobacteraceae bacterium]